MILPLGCRASSVGRVLQGHRPYGRTYGGVFDCARHASSKPSSHGRATKVARRIPAGIYAPSHRPIAIDPRLLDGSQNQVIEDSKRATNNENDLCVRPDLGTRGREIVLRTNYFAMTIPEGPFYQYAVVTTPPVSTTWMRRRIFELAESAETWREVLADLAVHDRSAKLVSPILLPQPLSIDVPFYFESKNPPMEGSQVYKTYNLTIKFERKLETESLKKYIAGDPRFCLHDVMPIVSALNLILAAWPTRSGGGGVMVGHNKFFMPNTRNSMPLGRGLEAFHGFHSSVRAAHKALMVNIDLCTAAFYKPGNLAVAFMDYMETKSRLTTFFKGLQIKTTHLGHRKAIRGTTEYTAKTYVFNHEEFGEISVEEYLFKKYAIELRYPSLPLVDLGGPKVNYLPPELCEILPNQPYHGKPLSEHTDAMARYSQAPNTIANIIETQGFKELGFSQNAPTLKAFGISVSHEMATIPGRIIPPPKIKYERRLDRKSFNDGAASWNLKNAKFLKGVTLRDWAVLLVQDGSRTEFRGPSDPKLLNTLKDFIDVCCKCGLNITSPPTISEVRLPSADQNDLGKEKGRTVIRNVLPVMFKQRPQLVLAILCNTDTHIYAELKRLLDLTLDLPSVCVVADKFKTGGPRYHSGVGLKINVKLGGTNHVLDKASVSWINEVSTMLVGIDVTHPGFAAVKDTPSVAAVVASVDRDCVHFPTSLRMQEPKKEMVSDLKEMMVERLKAFQLKSDKYPERILIYRDGVSEGQHKTVLKEELPAIIQACKEIDPGYRPQLTIVICVKNHHTRFFPTSVKDVNEKFYLLPGTVVDQGISSAHHFNFFLQANGSLRNIVRSTYYTVIHDEIGFTADQLQALTNNISYMYARATQAVGIASPVYYADLASERGRYYLHDMMYNTASDLASGGTAWEHATKYWGSGPTGKVIKKSMFYL